ncbi:MAG: arginase family protein [Solirubrobacteraceae bacterium]|nr:arginase family protein [Solirubrobacteraceae bacterium]
MRPAVALLGRTSERDETSVGARELGELVGAQMVGEIEPPRTARWDEDLREAGPVLEAARTAIHDGAELLIAGHCSLAIATLPAVAARHPGVRIAWLDAHPDFNSPETSASGFLGGMPLAAACGVWDAGLGPVPPPVDPTRVHLLGIRDVDPGEQELLDAHGVRRDAPADGPVYVHLDLDVLDGDLMPASFPAPGGWSWEELEAALAALPGIVGIEVTGCAPGRARRVADTLAQL